MDEPQKLHGEWDPETKSCIVIPCMPSILEGKARQKAGHLAVWMGVAVDYRLV